MYATLVEPFRLPFITRALAELLVLGALAGTVGVLILLTRHRAVTEDTALAVLLTTLFAVGVVLVSREAGYTTDLTAFLFGRVLTVTGSQLTETLAVTALVVAVLAALRRPLLACAFDSAYGSCCGGCSSSRSP